MFFVGETVPILSAVIAYIVWHFGKLLPDTTGAEWQNAFSGSETASAGSMEYGAGVVMRQPAEKVPLSPRAQAALGMPNGAPATYGV